MYLIAIGWIYVVLMMSITEQSIVAGVMTFLFYGVLPVLIIVYLGGSRRRRMKRLAEDGLRSNARKAQVTSDLTPDITFPAEKNDSAPN